jgi:hypothetical protein
VFFGALEASGSRAVELSTQDINIGMAKVIAAQVLGEEESHPYSREVAGGCRLVIEPAAGKMWTSVLQQGDVVIRVVAPQYPYPAELAGYRDGLQP